MKIMTPHLPWEEVRKLIRLPIRVAPLEKGEKLDWSINLRQGCQTRSQSAHESGRISQLLHKKLKDDHGASDHPRATEGQELWRCRGLGDTSRWDDNFGIGKSAIKSQALPGRTAGNGVFFRKDFAEGTIICPYEGKRVKPSEAADLAKMS